MERLTTGQMAKQNQTTKKTLMLYHREGLLTPEIIDPQTGYRYYSLSQSSILDIILQLQSVGLSLKEIKTILEHKDITYMRALLARQRTRLAQQHREIELARITTDRLFVTSGLLQQRPVCGVPTLEWVERQRILLFPIEPYWMGTHRTPEDPMLADWERSLRGIKKAFAERGLPLSLFHNVGCVISKESLVARRPYVTGGFIFAPPGFGEEQPEYWEAGYCLTITTDTMFSLEGDYLERRYLELLLDIAKRERYALTGDYYCEILAETPAFLYEGRDMMIRLRLPVAVPGPERLPARAIAVL